MNRTFLVFANKMANKMASKPLLSSLFPMHAGLLKRNYDRVTELALIPQFDKSLKVDTLFAQRVRSAHWMS